MRLTKWLKGRGHGIILEIVIFLSISGIFINYLWVQTVNTSVQQHLVPESRTRDKNSTYLWQSESLTNLMKLAENRYSINCSSIGEIKLGRKLGRGNFKTTYLGVFHGRTVAVKVPNENLTSSQINDCAKRILSPALTKGSPKVIRECLSTKCHPWSAEQFMHEIILVLFKT